MSDFSIQNMQNSRQAKQQRIKKSNVRFQLLVDFLVGLFMKLSKKDGLYSLLLDDYCLPDFSLSKALGYTFPGSLLAS